MELVLMVVDYLELELFLNYQYHLFDGIVLIV